jgi:hypothetical protein
MSADIQRLAALWYGYGRADAGPHVDAEAFAEWYATRVADFNGGRTSFLPSIRDSFTNWYNACPAGGPHEWGTLEEAGTGRTAIGCENCGTTAT